MQDARRTVTTSSSSSELSNGSGDEFVGSASFEPPLATTVTASPWSRRARLARNASSAIAGSTSLTITEALSLRQLAGVGEVRVRRRSPSLTATLLFRSMPTSHPGSSRECQLIENWSNYHMGPRARLHGDVSLLLARAMRRRRRLGDALLVPDWLRIRF